MKALIDKLFKLNDHFLSVAKTKPLSRTDPYLHEESWQTIELIEQLTVFVVHTWPEFNSAVDEEIGRIISVLRDTVYERRAYKEGMF